MIAALRTLAIKISISLHIICLFSDFMPSADPSVRPANWIFPEHAALLWTSGSSELHSNICWKMAFKILEQENKFQQVSFIASANVMNHWYFSLAYHIVSNICPWDVWSYYYVMLWQSCCETYFLVHIQDIRSGLVSHGWCHMVDTRNILI